MKSGTIEIDAKGYIGSYDSDDAYEKIAKLYLMCYIEILPILLQEYASDQENDYWNKEQYIQFMKDVASKIMQRVENKQKDMDAVVTLPVQGITEA